MNPVSYDLADKVIQTGVENQTILLDGTSAAAPVFAGMVTLVNSFLVQNGYPVLGFLNPFIYAMASESPEAFMDVTVGDNKCNRQWCCQYGYDATTGV